MSRRPYQPEEQFRLPDMEEIVRNNPKESWIRSHEANAYFEHCAENYLKTSLYSNLDTTMPKAVGRRDYLARVDSECSEWAPPFWMAEDPGWYNRFGSVEVKRHLREARVEKQCENYLKTTGRNDIAAQAFNAEAIAECDLLVAALGKESRAEEYRDLLGIPVIVLDNEERFPSFEEYRQILWQE